MAKVAKNRQKLMMTFCIKDKTLYIPNVGHMWAYIHANSQDFWKSFNGSHKTKHVKICG